MTRFTKNQKVRIIGHKEFLVGQFGVVAGLGAGLVWVRTCSNVSFSFPFMCLPSVHLPIGPSESVKSLCRTNPSKGRAICAPPCHRTPAV